MQTSENLKFIRTYLDLTIKDITNIIDTDQVRWWEMETKPDPTGSRFLSIPEYQSDLLILSDYLTIPFPVIVIDRIELDEDNLMCLSRVKAELLSGNEIDRKLFRKTVFENNRNSEKDETEEQVLKSILANIQQLNAMQKIYRKKRTNGTIDQINFFE